ncbi:GlxA family transcriptional regulator [Paractinoplanes rishiriensis]|uniref:Transcriptional regulator n=1 Tax=Paractinoplanes rishiriensis TaxID=1050105 RepID=A0A919JYG7_9ACTN|nr:GlxA family transcriptional regulator [Actinoplanes rishiriensis]GIE95999.1 transcriptional regulator [Actinoplanes rishiriensis]
MADHHVQIVLFDGVQSLDVTGPLEVFHYARGYRVTTASIGGAAVRTSSGLRLTPDEALAEPTVDTLVVPGGHGTRQPQPAVVAWLRAHAHRPARIMSVCTGAFLLAEAGLLDDRKATTHWMYCDTLAGRHPKVAVDPDPIFVRDGRIATSAGVTAGIDLALALVEEDRGRNVALGVARGLVMYLRRSGGQKQFSAQLSAQVAHREPLREVQRLIAEHPETDLSVAALAAHANLSPRQFTRAFAAEVGVPPGRYVDQVRLETARRLLEDTSDGIAEVARRAGYGTPEAMRRAFLQAVGVGPAEYRRRF